MLKREQLKLEYKPLLPNLTKMTNHNNTNTQEDDDGLGKGEFVLPFRMALPIVAVGSFIMALGLAFCCYMVRRKAQLRASGGFKEVVVKSKGKTNDLDSLKYNACVICLDEFKTRDALAICPCGHVFHKNCLKKWLIRRRTCPVCMEAIRPSLVCDPSDSGTSRRHRGMPV